MANVTVAGAHASVVTLTYGSAQNILLARQLAGAITAGVQSGMITPVNAATGTAQPTLTGTTGELVIQQNAFVDAQPGYDAIVVKAAHATVAGNGDSNVSVLAGAGKLTFLTGGGSGTLALGDGNDHIITTGGDTAWTFALGDGNNTINAAFGDDLVQTGAGYNAITLGSGFDTVSLGGTDTVSVQTGDAYIDASGAAGRTLVHGGAGEMVFIGGSSVASVVGGTGSETVFAADGGGYFKGGSDGFNAIDLGTGAATGVGAGAGDTITAGGSLGQVLYAGAGNETLDGSGSTGKDSFHVGKGSVSIIGGVGNDTIYGGAGKATVDASLGKDVYDFVKGHAGGTETIKDFGQFVATSTITLDGYGAKAVANAVADQTHNAAGTSSTITLSDHTKVTFQGISELTTKNFS